ncbi:hypothetical protein AB0A95_04505 [Micromonospora sp. NPDC049230]|uniref:hypothetical protein n=1 Tax=Micromonospora sp. NPDC049230 TaxID=3155502 RepID=UPI0033DF78BF
MAAVKAGDVVFVGPDCSVQFTGDRALLMRVVSIGEDDPYNDWVWITGYVRHEALFDRVEVGDLHRCPVVVGHRS